MKKEMSVYLIFTLLSFIVIGCLQTAGTITGKVTNNNGDPLEDVLVFVDPSNYAGFTNSEGVYKIGSLPLGNYTVTATTGSYTATVQASVVDSASSCSVPEIKVEDLKIGI